MKCVSILIVFFSIFTVASLLIPAPMFPGNLFCTFLGVALIYAKYLSALLNGVFYGAVLWMVFVLISRRLVAEK